MGNLRNYFSSSNSFENIKENNFQTNILNLFKAKIDNSSKKYNMAKNSKHDLENDLQKIKKKFAIIKIIKHFKQYKLKLKNDLLSPIQKLKEDYLQIDSLSYSNYLYSSIKKKRVSNYINNNRAISKILLNEKVPEELNIRDENHFYISTNTLTTRNNFDKFFQKFTNNNRNYISYDNNYLFKQKGIIKFSLEENNFYIGEFFLNDLSGYGMFINNKKIIYEGYWRKNIQIGYGIESWENGSIYKGEFKNGFKNGIGTYIWADNSKYEGEWTNNCFNGFGIYNYSDNKIYFGEWKMNVKNGFGVYFTNDIIYIGNYENDKKNGFGIYFWRKKNEAFIGFFKGGKQYGFGKYIFKNQKSKYGIWGYENNNSKVKWFQNIKDIHKILIKNGNDKYKSFFNFNIEEIINYCKIIISDDIVNYNNDYNRYK